MKIFKDPVRFSTKDNHLKVKFGVFVTANTIAMVTYFC